MPAKPRLKVVLYWHMHQPDYRDLRTGEYQLPWTYLHAIKDYVDMAAHLEARPEAKAVVNFAPILLEQIDDYAQQVDGYLNNNLAIRDKLLASLIEPAFPAGAGQHLELIKTCLRANGERLIDRFPQYKKLAEMSVRLNEHSDSLHYFNNQYLADLVVWYHLAWLGESVRRGDARIKRLIDKGAAYTLHDRRELLTVIGELLSGTIMRYRLLAQRGQVELSVSPYAHPILPLLLDIASAKEALPEISLPAMERYPGGETRSRWHMDKAVETFERLFGFTPRGCWPSEGGLSKATAELLCDYGFAWTASGGNVLHNSLDASNLLAKNAEVCIHRPYRVKSADLTCFFRDDGLSDLIGFTYSDWHGDDAVANMVHHLENIAGKCAQNPDSIVSIILDGENAWEHYPENGYHFISGLYKALSDHPRLELTTYSDYLDSGKKEAVELSELVSGSWVYGTFSTWIGDPDKNRGWDMLGDAKRCFDSVATMLDNDHLQHAERQLAVCEGSDWFWWFGEYNPAVTVGEFERLFRLHLSNLYQLLGKEPPPYLAETFAHGSGTPQKGGVMRPGQPQEH